MQPLTSERGQPTSPTVSTARVSPSVRLYQTYLQCLNIRTTSDPAIDARPQTTHAIILPRTVRTFLQQRLHHILTTLRLNEQLNNGSCDAMVLGGYNDHAEMCALWEYLASVYPASHQHLRASSKRHGSTGSWSSPWTGRVISWHSMRSHRHRGGQQVCFNVIHSFPPYY
jgi:hypothetical protein